METLHELERQGRYGELTALAKTMLKKDPENIQGTAVKDWIGKRWRNLFISNAEKYFEPMDSAHKKKILGKDKRSDREKITARFLRGQGQEEWNIELPPVPDFRLKNTTLIFCPGFLNGLLPVMAFKDEFPEAAEKFGIHILQSDSHPVRSCLGNTDDILNAVEKGIGLDRNGNKTHANPEIPNEKIILLCYSKGMPDALELLAIRPDLRNRITAVFNIAGAPGGSFLANRFYDLIKDLEIRYEFSREFLYLLKLINPLVQIPENFGPVRLNEFDLKGGLLDLTTFRRESFLKEHMDSINDLKIPFFSLPAFTTAMEVPYFQLQGYLEIDKFDTSNDMQVAYRHSVLNCSMNTNLALLHGHHWDVCYGPFPKSMRLGSPNLDHHFPKTASLDACIQLAWELGLAE